MPALSVRSVLISGLDGASVSAVAFSGALGCDTFPAGSVAFAVTSPAGSSTVGVIVAFPFSSATPSPILLPSLSNNSTLDPGSAVTSTGVLVPALSVKSVLISGLAGAFVSGVELGSVTVTLTGTSSVDPSGYVTTTVASFSPGVVVSTGSLKATVVPLGRSLTFPIESSAFGVVPLATVCGLAVGVFLSASVGFLVTNSDNGLESVEPSL